MPEITPVIMSGGSGTRLWPLSRKDNPKQYRALVTDRSMLEETVARVHADAPVVICNRRDAQRIEALVPGATVITEPVGRNTAPVAIVASLHVAARDPEGLVLLLPADHHVREPAGFREAVERGRAAAERGHLVTLGIKPTAPETGYGYIRRGEALGDSVFRVDAFREKPDEETARRYLAEGGYAWNAGIFLFRARDLLGEAERHVPDMLAATREAYARAGREGRVLHLDEESFAAVPADSIDYAIMERTDRAAVVDPVEVGWDDIGAWSAVAALAEGDAKGEAVMLGCEGSYAHTDGPLVAMVGAKDVIVVATGDAVLVIDKNRTQEVKAVIEALKARGREDLL
jgi:mannose-1-phosphate guanylyltransferase/mannose-6-phosphate isomerase